MVRDRVLHNGIQLPERWPPSEAYDLEKPTPYLVSPPEVSPSTFAVSSSWTTSSSEARP